MNKKGDITSLAIIVVVIIILAFMAIIFAKLTNTVGSKIENSPVFDSDTKGKVTSLTSKAIPLFDNVVFYLFIGLFIALLISCVFIDVHPAFVIVFILFLFVITYISGVFSDIYAKFIGAEAISGTASQFTKTNLILGSHFPQIIFFIGVLAIIILYGKARMGQTNEI